MKLESPGQNECVVKKRQTERNCFMSVHKNRKRN